MTVPGRKVQTDIPRSEGDFKTCGLVDLFTTVSKIIFQAFLFLNALFFQVQHPVMCEKLHTFVCDGVKSKVGVIFTFKC